MFAKTKRKLMIALTLATSSIVLFIIIGIFGSIYISNKHLDQRALEDIIRFHSGVDSQAMKPPKEPELEESNPIFSFDNMRQKNDNIRRFYFYFIVNEGEIVDFEKNMPNFIVNPNSNEQIDLEIKPEDIYNQIDENSGSGKIKVNGLSFIYDTEEVDEGTMYVFLDTSMSDEFFVRGLKMGLLILVLTVIYILIIGRPIVDKILNPLEVSIDLQKRFTGDASHELRTPLTAMRSNVDILMNYDLPKEEQETWLNNISNEIDRMTKLTSDLLQLSRNEIVEREFDDFELSDVFDNIYLNYKNICDINMTGGEFLINGNKQEFHQLLMIFIDNAVKYNSKENKKIDIDAKTDKNKKYFTLTIQDNGDGINHDKFDDIFERFYREDKARTGTSNGFGLGLSIAKNIINNYDGKVKIESVIDNGTTFKITFPLKKQV